MTRYKFEITKRVSDDEAFHFYVQGRVTGIEKDGIYIYVENGNWKGFIDTSGKLLITETKAEVDLSNGNYHISFWKKPTERSLPADDCISY